MCAVSAALRMRPDHSTTAGCQHGCQPFPPGDLCWGPARCVCAYPSQLALLRTWEQCFSNTANFWRFSTDSLGGPSSRGSVLRSSMSGRMKLAGPVGSSHHQQLLVNRMCMAYVLVQGSMQVHWCLLRDGSQDKRTSASCCWATIPGHSDQRLAAGVLRALQDALLSVGVLCPSCFWHKTRPKGWEQGMLHCRRAAAASDADTGGHTGSAYQCLCMSQGLRGGAKAARRKD